MDEFMGGFGLFGMSLLILIPFIVEGIKSAVRQAGHELGGMAAVVVVVAVAWGLLALGALVAPPSDVDGIVRYILAGVLLPLANMGTYKAAKGLAGR